MVLHHSPPAPRLSFDIFCRVIDNFGDIGVCWRLARQLVQTAARPPVRLWVDDLTRFGSLEHELDTEAALQQLNGVDIVRWDDPIPDLRPHQVVIEAFGCNLPEPFVHAMTTTNSLWLNLEYLSAEPWVQGFHGQPSIQPSGVRKFFFFPGFTRDTGGLLREPGLIRHRQAWQADTGYRDALLQSCGLPVRDIKTLHHGARLVYLFCYPDAPVPALLSALGRDATPSIVLIPEGVYPRLAALSASGWSWPEERIRIHRIPFVSQTDFDHLLWSADLNVVRGEDSLVRALWAARPMIWQPYSQNDDIHLDKLDAWLALSPWDTVTKDLIRNWTTGNDERLVHALTRHLQPERWAQWQARTQQWSGQLADHDDLVTSLLRFCTQHQGTG